MYNRGFRQATIALYRFFGNMKKTSQALNIGLATVWRWVRNNACFSPRKPNPFPEALKEYVRLCVLQENHTTQSILIQKVKDALGIKVSRKCVACVLSSLGLTRKRLRNRGKLPSAIPIELFSKFKTQVSTAESVVAIDEVGFDQRMTPLYGYSPKGTKAIAVTHPTSRKHFTAIAAIDRFGKKQVCIHTASVDSTAFATFIRSLEWSRGTTLILDNARIHKTEEVREAFFAKGYIAAYTPPYSPDCNPIENMFSLVKNRFRFKVLDHVIDLDKVIQECFESLHPSVCLNCFQRMEIKVLKNVPQL
jgi:transposase